MMDWTKNNSTETGKTETPSVPPSVVDMSLVHSRVRYAPLSQLEAYWQGLRGTRIMPQRSEIDPRGLKGCLEYCFVLERIAPGLARMRVAGSHLGDLMGMEVRGMPISSFLSADSREEFGLALEEVFEQPAVATVHLVAETGLGRPPLRARMLLMPVRSDLGDTSRVLGGLVTDGDVGRVPRRFKVEKIEVERVAGVDPIVRTGRPALAQDIFKTAERNAPQTGENASAATPAAAPERASGMAETPSKFEPALPGVPYLRVVK